MIYRPQAFSSGIARLFYKSLHIIRLFSGGGGDRNYPEADPIARAAAAASIRIAGGDRMNARRRLFLVVALAFALAAPALAASEPRLATQGGALSTASDADQLFNAQRWADAAQAFEEVTKR